MLEKLRYKACNKVLEYHDLSDTFDNTASCGPGISRLSSLASDVKHAPVVEVFEHQTPHCLIEDFEQDPTYIVMLGIDCLDKRYNDSTVMCGGPGTNTFFLPTSTYRKTLRNI